MMNTIRFIGDNTAANYSSDINFEIAATANLQTPEISNKQFKSINKILSAVEKRLNRPIERDYSFSYSPVPDEIITSLLNSKIASDKSYGRFLQTGKYVAVSIENNENKFDTFILPERVEAEAQADNLPIDDVYGQSVVHELIVKNLSIAGLGKN